MQNWRRAARIVFQIVLPVGIVLAVGWKFVETLRNPALANVSYHLRVQWLIPAALLYLMAHSIWASFWVTLLRHQGFQASYGTGLRAYFISQLGKYIPGKIWVILFRVVMLGANRKDKTIVGVTATYEALTAMAGGAIMAAILLPMLDIDLNPNAGNANAGNQQAVGQADQTVPPAANAGSSNQQIASQAKQSVLLSVALIPLGVFLLHRLVIRIVRKRFGPDVHLPNLSLWVLLRGLLQASVGWLLLGLSVWMVAQAIRPEEIPFTWEDLLRYTAINALSYILGFVVLVAPAGSGVREWVLAELIPFELLSANLPLNEAKGFAVVIAIVVRLLWTVAEGILIALLYWLIPAAKRPHLTAKVDETTSLPPAPPDRIAVASLPNAEVREATP